MFPTKPSDIPSSIDVLTLKSGFPVLVRFVKPNDGPELQDYFRGLSRESRYNRFLTAISELPANQLRKVLERTSEHFAIIAKACIDGVSVVVGEARYAYDPLTNAVEFGLSIDDRWQGKGLGVALLQHIEARALALGASALVGDTLYSNAGMLALARKRGFDFTNAPSDWRLVRLEKRLPAARFAIPLAPVDVQTPAAMAVH